MRFEKEVSIFTKNAILKRFQANETNLSIVQGKISAIISEDEITELQSGRVTMYSKLGEVRVSHKGDRFCFYIPEPGSVYVHENMKENEFIKVLIELVQKHECTKVKLLDLFASYWEKTECQEMDNGEFDFYIRFLDKADDAYYYCFKDEGFHFIYHRFLPEDYEDFGF